MQWLTEKSEEFPDLRKAGPPTEWTLMASAGNSQTNSEGSASTITEAAIKLAVETMAQSIAILARRQNFLEPIQQQTTFKIEQPENSVFPEHLPPATITDLSVASACINNKIYDRQSLPDCVSLTDEEFAARNTPAVPSDLSTVPQAQQSISTLTYGGIMGKAFAPYSTQEQQSVYG
jgi:hypothetical protein